jgi:two-component system sensor histidine kinase and response regulator WspE
MSAPPALVLLFLSDTGAHLSAMRRALASVGKDTPTERNVLSELLVGAHSIRGAAKIIAFDPAVQLADALESLLREIEHGAAGLEARHVPPIEACADCLEQMVAAGGEGLAEWARTRHEAITRVIAQLKPSAEALPLRSVATPASGPARAPRSSAAPRAEATLSPSILQLFRAETASSTEVLSRGLVELEAGGRADLEGLMRAAHSIKGAARVVGIDLAVQLAHSLEDCLVKAQTGLLRLPREAIDVLLAAVDVLSEIGQLSPAEVESLQAERGAGVSEVLNRLRALAQLGSALPGAPGALEGESKRLAARLSGAAGDVRIQIKASESAVPAPTATPPAASLLPAASAAPGPVAVAPPPSASLTPARDRVVRVNAQSINRLMGLAGESLVESRRVQTFGSALGRLRRRQAELVTLLETLDRQSSSTLDPLARATLDDARARAAECRALLGEQMTELDVYARRVDDLSDRLYREALKSRMRPFSDCAHGFPRLVRDLARQLGKETRFELSGEATDVDRDVLESLDAPLTHLLRNAVDHGLEPAAERALAGKPAQGVVRIEARHHAGMLAITVTDDGRGIDPARLRTKIVERGLLADSVVQNLSLSELFEFIFLPGFSTASSVTEISGRGVGLDAVRSMVEAASGVVRVSSEVGRGTSFYLQLPVTRSVMRAVVAEVAGEAYAFPLLRIERILRAAAAGVQTLGAVQYFVLDGENVSLIAAAQVLGFNVEQPSTKEICVVVIGDRTRRYGVAVDKFLGEHDLVVRPLDPRLGKVQDIAAAAILVDGSPALILDVDDLLRSIEKLAQAGRIDRLTAGSDAKRGAPRKRVLVVDDSITVREVERQLLVNHGYEVDVAVDGIDGLNSVRSQRYDLIVSDIDMPRMSGIELVRSIKQDPKLGATPIIIVSYKDREEDRMRGLDAGANYYLTKSSFHDETLVRAVEDLIGSANA